MEAGRCQGSVPFYPEFRPRSTGQLLLRSLLIVGGPNTTERAAFFHRVDGAILPLMSDSEEHIHCQICGKRLRWLPPHLKVHNISCGEYKARYPHSPVLVESLRSAYAAGAYKMNRDPAACKKRDEVNRQRMKRQNADPEFCRRKLKGLRSPKNREIHRRLFRERKLDPVFEEKRKRGIHRSTFYRGLRMSSWEADVAKFLDNLGEPWLYEPRVELKEGVPYHPDFYLPRVSVYIEVKPDFRKNELWKIKSLGDSGHKTSVVGNTKMRKIWSRLQVAFKE